MRILGIDPGERRVGLAVSDELGITAQGLDTFDKQGGIDLVPYIRELVDSFDIEKIVVGYPIGLSGQLGTSAEGAKQLAHVLQEQIGLEVTLWDERFSSEEARRVLKGQRANKSDVDKLAAVIILQSYLDFSRRSG